MSEERISESSHYAFPGTNGKGTCPSRNVGNNEELWIAPSGTNIANQNLNKFKGFLPAPIYAFPHKIIDVQTYKTPWPGDPRVNIQNAKGKAKPYQVNQVLEAIEKLGTQKSESE
ncbi:MULTISPECIES: hypothetical protein [Corynebacterium]|uniref:hypothetical protein n=1 Tax=Corynebacterium TaxID=1716 RepID=UPI000AB9F29C|nr:MULTISPECIES: hypothetical protein [Corynebacterium]MCZ2117685.1 hypothetical protein [Corynebacterium lipophilum]MDK8243037.1 hypothetical protein [Corynebacterium sp. UMB10321]UUA87458.1 hypothetical protein KBP54_00970 [Corynebacterium pseudogenitalium]WPJ92070.1 hypothetical protein R0V12_07180 [Corynebacterium sp. UMB2355A]